MDLEEVLLKDVADLTDEDKDVLKENWSDLTEDEQENFASVNPSAPTGPTGSTGSTGPTGKTEEKFSFDSKEDFDRAIQERVDQKIAELKDQLKPEDKKGEEKSPDFVDPAWTPKNWNEAAQTLYPKFEEAIIGKIQKLSAEQKSKIDEINKSFDKELIDIRTENPNLPKVGTEEGDKFEMELSQIGTKYKLVTMKDCYNIYKDLHANDKAPNPTQKNLADKVSHGGNTTPAQATIKYKDISAKSMDEMADEALSRLKQTS